MRPARGLQQLPGGMLFHQGLAAVHKIMDQSYDAAVAGVGRPVSCRAGCAACCNLQVTVILPDAVGMVLELCRTPVGREALVRAVPKMHRQAILLSHPSMTDARWHERQEPCVLLTADKMCGVYPVRPGGCRTHGVWNDPALCAIPNAKGAMVNSQWIQSAGRPLRQLADLGRIPFLSGPLPWSVLLACYLVREGQEAFQRRLRGTCFENDHMGSVAWIHLEADGAGQDSRHGLPAAYKDARSAEFLADFKNRYPMSRSRQVRRVIGDKPPPWRSDDFVLPAGDMPAQEVAL